MLSQMQISICCMHMNWSLTWYTSKIVVKYSLDIGGKLWLTITHVRIFKNSVGYKPQRKISIYILLNQMTS